MREREQRSLKTLPSATGGLSRIAFARARKAGIELAPLLKKAGLTAKEINDRSTRISVHRQIRFLNLISDNLRDPLLGFHLAESFDLRELGLVYYVAASSDTLGDALRRARGTVRSRMKGCRCRMSGAGNRDSWCGTWESLGTQTRTRWNSP